MYFEWELSAFSSHRSVNKFMIRNDSVESGSGPQYKYLNWYGSNFYLTVFWNLNYNGFWKFREVNLIKECKKNKSWTLLTIITSFPTIAEMFASPVKHPYLQYKLLTFDDTIPAWLSLL